MVSLRKTEALFCKKEALLCKEKDRPSTPNMKKCDLAQSLREVQHKLREIQYMREELQKMIQAVPKVSTCKQFGRLILPRLGKILKITFKKVHDR